MLFRKNILSTRTLLQAAAATLFASAAVGTAFAANPPIAPLLVPYTIQTVAGTPQYPGTTTAVSVGYFGEGVPATTSLANKTGAAVLNGSYSVAVDSVGNIYIADTKNYIIREVNAQTGLMTTVAGVIPKACSGVSCTVRASGCADGVPAAGSPIGSQIEGIAVDGYDNVFFADYTTASISVIYRGGTQIANFIKLVNPGGVTASGGTVQPGYVYHIAGAVNLTNCGPTKGNVDNGIAFTNTASGAAPTAEIATPAQLFFITLDSADNIYVSDTGNFTTRVINTQATPQTFFQYTVQPGYMRSITDCNSLLTVACPTGLVTVTANTGINGPANGLVQGSQFKSSSADAYGNIYQVVGTGGGISPPGYYGDAEYAGGPPLTNLLVAEAPSYTPLYGPELNSNGLPTYGNAYADLANPGLNAVSSGSIIDELVMTDDQDWFIRPAYFFSDNLGSFWYLDTHYPLFSRVDQYTGLETELLRNARATASVTNLFNNAPASFSNPWYCVYGSGGSSPIPWNQGPQTYDPQADGCPITVAYFNGGNQMTADGLGNIYLDDSGEQLVRQLQIGNVFPATAVGTSTPVTQAIEVHFNSNNPPVTGGTIPDAGATGVGVTTTSFSIASGIPDFTINTTTPEFPMGSLIGGGGYSQTTTTANFQMWAGLPTCMQLGQYPRNTGVTDYDCLVYVSFNPSAPGVRESQLVVKTANNLTYNIALYGIGTGPQLAIDGGTSAAIAAGFKAPAAVAVSSSGTLYIADPGNNRIVVQPAGGAQTNLAFTGVTPATLSGPMGVALDAANNIYISDTGNNRILKVNGTTNVATVLGTYVWVPGSTCYGATPAPDCPTTTPSTVQATTAPPQYAFNAPQGLAVDVWNNVYVADTGNKAVVEIPSNINLGGAIPLLSYTGAPTFKKPVAVAVDSQGNIYVADSGIAGGLIVKLPPGGGDLVTLPGNTFPTVQNSVNANLSSPNGLAVDAAGDVYVSDNVANTVTEIPVGTGPGSSPFTLNFPSVSSPSGLALDPNGNLYVVDTGNNQVLLDNRQNPTINFGTVPQNITSGIANTPNPCPVSGVATPCTGALTVTNTGTVPVTLSSTLFAVTGSANPAFSIPTVGSNCSNPLPSGLSCTLSPTFAPISNGAQSESATLNGGSQTITLQGTGEAPLGPTVLTASYSVGTTPTAGATATVTATVTSQVKGNIPTGTVSFTYLIQGDGIKGTASGTLNSSGVTSFTLPTLLQGRRYTVNAVYSGDSVNSSTDSNTLVIYVPGVPVSVVASPVTFVYGQTPPKISGTVTGIVDTAVTYTFTSAASACTPIGTYPITVVFSGGSYLNYGFPPAVTSTGAPAVVTETAAPLSYTLPNFTAQYGAQNLSYGASTSPVGAVCGDFFGASFTPAQSSILNVGTYTVTPTLAPASKASNYTITAPTSTLTVTQAPVAITITPAKTSVLNTASAVAAATYQISVGTAVSLGKGTPTGTVTVTDNFTPITATGYGTPAAPATYTVPLVAGSGTYTPTSTVNGLHQYSFTYSGDSNFQTASVAPAATAAPCTLAAIATNCLVVDNPDFTLTSLASVILINPGTVPSGNGLPAAPNQSTAYPESAVLFVNTVLGFTGSISLSCTTQNPSYVTCFMTPTTVCFASTSSPACTNTATSAATVVAIETPATLPLGFFGQTRISPTKTMLAFLPFGVLAFCVRRRGRLSKALWMLIAIVGVGAAMTGCGGNQVAFYTPVPSGPQTVTVTATYLGNGGTQPAEARSFAVPIAIE